jgi:thiol-disulfide isomerase/thioredoxin
MKRTILFALLFLCCCGAVAAHVFATRAAATSPHQQRRSSRARKVSPKTAQAKPVLVREIDLAGLKKLLAHNESQTRTGRPLLVNFWATWCEPCREEFPDLVRIDKDYKERGLEFIVVSLDDVEELNKGVPEFLQQMHATMPAYLLNVPDQEAAMDAVDPQWGGAMPATFLFDGKNQIVFKRMKRINAVELRAAIEKTIKK